MKFTIIGDGAMGTACAIILARKPDQKVSIWCQFSENADRLNQHCENSRYLPGVPIPPEIHVTADFTEVRDADAFVVAVPVVHLAATLERLRDEWPAGVPVVSAAKGIEQDTFRTPSQIISEVLRTGAVIALSGPSHAEEMARGMPTSVVAASGDVQAAQNAQTWFNDERFRVYTSHDVRGVELAGALKNIIGLAAGICDGLGLGDNAKSALMARGLAEMQRFGTALGAEAATFQGLAGVGDLITTCISSHGRNRMVGEELGKGRTLAAILDSTPKVAEGVWTCRSVHDLAQQRGIDLPVTEQVYNILFENLPPKEAVQALMSREPKPERAGGR